MENIFTNIKCSEIILSNANENWYIILYDLFSRLCYIATCGPFCKDATHIFFSVIHFIEFYQIFDDVSTSWMDKSVDEDIWKSSCLCYIIAFLFCLL